jgi:nicotinamidase-related amidase
MVAHQQGDVMLLDAAHSFLVVVDVQERLAPAMTAGEDAIARCALLMKAARRLEVPILLSEQYPKGLGPTVPALAALAPEDATVAKLHFSCAEEPAFIDKVETLRRDHAVICGIEAHVCVLQTAIGLADRGYAVIVVEDAIASRRPSDKAAALRRVERAGVSVVTSEMVVYEWLGQAGTEAFKELSQLMR